MNLSKGFGLVQGGFIPGNKKRDNPVVSENKNRGTVEWQLHLVRLDDPETYWSYPLNRRIRSSAIEGYASKTSLYPGESIDFFVSTRGDMDFTIDIYRSGYYGGLGARHMAKLGPFKGKSQPVPMMGNERARECNWESCTNFTIPDDWKSGVYLAKLAREERFGAESYMIFIVKEDRKSDLLFQCSDLTWQAYNKWPANDSIYDDGSPEIWYTGSNVRVSSDRPYAKYCQVYDASYSVGSGSYLIWELPFAYWLEAEGYDVTYCSNVDLDRESAILKNCKAMLSIGHDEYWSRKMFNAVKTARDDGMSIGFFSGNSICHDIIFYDSSVTGAPLRTYARKSRYQDEDTLMGVKTYGSNFGDWVVTKENHCTEITGLFFYFPLL